MNERGKRREGENVYVMTPSGLKLNTVTGVIYCVDFLWCCV